MTDQPSVSSSAGGLVDAHPDPGADPACDVAHGAAPVPAVSRTLVAVFASPVAGFLLRYAADAGFRPVLVEPDAERAARPGPASPPPAPSMGTSMRSPMSW